MIQQIIVVIILMVAIMKTISPSGCRSGGQIATWQRKAPLTMGTTKQPNVSQLFSQFCYCAFSYFYLFTFQIFHGNLAWKPLSFPCWTKSFPFYFVADWVLHNNLSFSTIIIILESLSIQPQILIVRRLCKWQFNTDIQFHNTANTLNLIRNSYSYLELSTKSYIILKHKGRTYEIYIKFCVMVWPKSLDGFILNEYLPHDVVCSRCEWKGDDKEQTR